MPLLSMGTCTVQKSSFFPRGAYTLFHKLQKYTNIAHKSSFLASAAIVITLMSHVNCVAGKKLGPLFSCCGFTEGTRENS